MKKALSLFLTLVMVIGMIPVAALPAFAEETAPQTETTATTTVVNIYNATVPETDTTGKTFMSLIGTTLAADTTYKLMEDIDLGDHQIKNSTAITLASGVVIDGNGHTVTGFNLAGGNGVGLFNGNISSGTVSIKNIKFGTKNDPIVFTHDGGKYAAAGMGLVKATDSNVTINFNNADIFISAAVKGTDWQNYGSFVARNWGTLNFENCTANGTMAGHGQLGGFVGWSSGAKNITFKNCINNVNVSKDGGGYYGGFVGLTENSTGSTIKFTNCINNGTIDGERQAGGFIGGTISKIVIERSTNAGNVTASTAAAGGFIGNYAHNSVAITNSANKGNVTANNGHAGGVIGTANILAGTITVSDFYNTGNITSTSSAGGVIGISELKVDNVAQDNSDLTIDIDRLINTGTVKGRWRGCAATGYINLATVTIDNSISTGQAIQSSNNSVSFAFCDNASNTGNVTGNGNYAVYGQAMGAGDEGLVVNLGQSLSDILDVIKNTDNESAHGRFALNAAGNNIVVATPEFEGYQLGTTVSDNIVKLRLLATIGDVNVFEGNCEYTYLGFKITVDGADATYTGVMYVYNSIKAMNGDKEVTYTATALGGKYIYAEVLQLDATKAHTVKVQTFASDVVTDSPEETDLYYGAEYTINVPAMAAAN